MKRYDNVSIILYDYYYDADDDSILYTDHDHEYDNWIICRWIDGWQQKWCQWFNKMKAMMMITHEDENNHTWGWR